jgi:hypothetical protein
MIQSGQVTAAEGARLLQALEKKDTPQEHRPAGREKRPRQVRIRVTDLETGQEKVNMRLPWSLVNVGTGMGARFVSKGIELTEFTTAIQAGTEGKIMDLLDEEDGERVEIFVE